MGYKIIFVLGMNYTNRRVCTDWSKLLSVKYDQIKKNVHSPTKSKHVTDISKFN